MFTNMGRENTCNEENNVVVETIAEKLKKSFEVNQGNVDIVSIEAFLIDFRKLGENAGVVGFDVVDDLGDKIDNFKDLEIGLMMKGFCIIELHFADGEKFEVVIRVNHTQQKIYTFCYKL